jgi:hypothetical protein
VNEGELLSVERKGSDDIAPESYKNDNKSDRESYKTDTDRESYKTDGDRESCRNDIEGESYKKNLDIVQDSRPLDIDKESDKMSLSRDYAEIYTTSFEKENEEDKYVGVREEEGERREEEEKRGEEEEEHEEEKEGVGTRLDRLLSPGDVPIATYNCIRVLPLALCPAGRWRGKGDILCYQFSFFFFL